jgi:hypothetical protein
MPEKFSRGFIVMGLLAALAAFLGIWRLVIGDTNTGPMLMGIATLIGYTASGFEAIAIYEACLSKRKLPRKLT